VNCLCPETSKFHDRQFYGRQFADPNISFVPKADFHLETSSYFVTTMIISGCSFSKIVIIQSLEPDEIATGRILSEFISPLIFKFNHQTHLEFVTCLSCVESKRSINSRLVDGC